MAARLLWFAAALALGAAGCKDRKDRAPRGAVRVVVDAAGPAIDAGVPDLGFVRGDVVIDQLRDGRHQPARLDSATRTWTPLGDGVGDLYATGHRLGDGLLAIATTGSHEDDHQEQLAIAWSPDGQAMIVARRAAGGAAAVVLVRVADGATIDRWPGDPAYLRWIAP